MNSLGRLLSGLFGVYARQHHAGDVGCFAGAGEVRPEMKAIIAMIASREAWFGL